MTDVEQLITENLDVWSSAVKTRSSAGRGSSKKLTLHGIKKLRELILELAVRGLLVPQNSNDEPASVLLKKVSAEKERQIKSSKIKKQLTPIREDEKPFQLPVGWAVVRLGDYAHVFSGNSFKSGDFKTDGGARVIKITNAGVGELIETNDFLPEEFLVEYGNYKVIQGDLILALTRPYISTGLKVSFCPRLYDNALLNQRVAAIRVFAASNFLYQYMQSVFVLGVYKKRFGGSGLQPNLKMGDVTELVIPVPPLDEQHRIVAKVDELMALCDQLEQQQENSISAHQTLVETLLTALTNAGEKGEFNQAWARIAEHFDTLFTTERSIDQLKQTILQLAVMGKLVPQDPNDEPASVLLKKIAAEKAQLIKDKKIKKQKALPPVGEGEKSFELPGGWEYARFAEITNEVATGPFGSMIHKRDYIEGGIPLINPSHMINSQIVEDPNISVNQCKFEELKSHRLIVGDIVMARRGEMGRCALVTTREEGWLCGTGSFVLRFQGLLSRHYILLLFKTQWTRDYLGGNSIGTTMTNLNHGILNKLPLLLPPLSEQIRIIKRANELIVICDSLKVLIGESQTTQLHLADAMAKQAIG